MSITKISQWVRTLGVRTSASMLVLVACLTVLTLILHDQYGPRVAVNTPQFVPEALSQAGDTVALDRDTDALPTAEDVRYRVLAGYLAKRYRVSQDITFDLVSHAHDVGHEIGLDPLLIIAVIAIESRFNPIAESVAGAKGLMQVIPKYHADKLEEFGGEKAVYDPEANIVIGARILKEYIRYTGSLGSALQMYAGALSDSEDQYTNRVLNERLRLQEALARALSRAIPTKTAFAGQLQVPALD
jgi:hypothetical protein